VALYASATTHQVRFQIGGNTLDISAQDVDFGGEAAEKLPCSYTGEAMEIGFNSVYLVDILSHLEGDQVELRFSAPTKAGIVAPAGSGSQENVIMLVMPVRLAG
jgi:DNA polymerase-3 subunit beta